MKHDLLAKLMGLFDEKLSDHDDASPSPSALVSPINWGELSAIEENTYFARSANLASKRIFSPQERLKLTKKSYQFLEQLIQLDLIGEYSLELIINQLLFSTSAFVHLDETKWTVEQTLSEGLDKTQQAFLDLVLYDKEDQVLQH